MRALALVVALGIAACAPSRAARAQAEGPAPEGLPPANYGSLTQNDLALRVRNDEIDVRFIPLDERVTRLLARDSYESLRSLLISRRAAIDSVARPRGISDPGLALVTFFGQRANARFDPQTLSLLIRNRVYRPLGIVPFSARFTSQQLDVREQVSAIYVFEQELPVTDTFSFSYNELTSDEWLGKQRQLDRERARVAARARGDRPDSSTAPPR
ncbi:MAG: hypothetical protein ACREMG_11325 [Gemmatimonadales bacterium]